MNHKPYQRRRFVPTVVWFTAGVAVTVLVSLGVVVVLRAMRTAEIAMRGATVMPFDLDRTTHVFDTTDRGGIQQVLADDPADSTQVRLIQAHVQAEAAQFRAGDFSDPASLHGTEMPGLAALTQGASRIAVAYSELPAGAQITYRTADATLVTALHQWFAAQLADHGADARPGTYDEHHP